MASVLSESLLTKLTLIIGSITTQTAQSGTVPASKQLLLKEINEFKDMLLAAKHYAQSLEGGHLTTEEQDDIISMLEEIKLQKRDALATALEGFNAPNTYHEVPDVDVDSMASTPVAQTSLRPDDVAQAAPTSVSPNTPSLPSYEPAPSPTLLPIYLLHPYFVLMQIFWVSPSFGDVYHAGDSIPCEWQTKQPVLSPSFRLCTPPSQSLSRRACAQQNNCGSTVFPIVHQTNESYQAFVVAPNITYTGRFYIEMEDISGATSPSPPITLAPGESLSSRLSSASYDNTTPDPNPEPDNEPTPIQLQSRMPPPTAAYIVPIILVALIVVAAVLTGIYRHRKSIQERKVANRTLISGVHPDGDSDDHRLRWSVMLNRLGSNGPHDSEKDIFTSVYRSPPSQRPPREIARSACNTGCVIAPPRNVESALSPRMPHANRGDAFQVAQVDESVDVTDTAMSHYLLPSPPLPPLDSVPHAPHLPPKSQMT